MYQTVYRKAMLRRSADQAEQLSLNSSTIHDELIFHGVLEKYGISTASIWNCSRMKFYISFSTFRSTTSRTRNLVLI